MTAVVSALMLAIGVAIVLLSCLGVAVMPTAYDRLHFTGPAATLGVLGIAGSIVVREGLSQSGIKAALCAVLLLATSPIVAHATGRAIYLRHREHVDEREVDEPGARP